MSNIDDATLLEDEFLTVDAETIGEGFYSEKRSKFFAFSHHVETTEDVKELVANYRKKYHDARHVCYAYVLGYERNVFRANDDGEPSSTAGKPILGQINSKGLTDVLVVVVRYYGGINLGTSRLIVAYRQAALDALEHHPVEKRIREEQVNITFEYIKQNDVMRILKDCGARMLQANYDNNCNLLVSIRNNDAERMKEQLTKCGATLS